jgi:hypothetical protein
MKILVSIISLRNMLYMAARQASRRQAVPALTAGYAYFLVGVGRRWYKHIYQVTKLHKKMYM